MNVTAVCLAAPFVAAAGSALLIAVNAIPVRRYVWPGVAFAATTAIILLLMEGTAH